MNLHEIVNEWRNGCSNSAHSTGLPKLLGHHCAECDAAAMRAVCRWHDAHRLPAMSTPAAEYSEGEAPIVSVLAQILDRASALQLTMRKLAMGRITIDARTEGRHTSIAVDRDSREKGDPVARGLEYVLRMVHAELVR